LADSQRLCFELATASDVDLTTDRPVPRQPGTNRSLGASPSRLRWLRVNTITAGSVQGQRPHRETGMEPSSRKARYATGFPLMGTAGDLNRDGKPDLARCSSGTSPGVSVESLASGSHGDHGSLFRLRFTRTIKTPVSRSPPDKSAGPCH
jgi:hypothetical protein